MTTEPCPTCSNPPNDEVEDLYARLEASEAARAKAEGERDEARAYRDQYLVDKELYQRHWELMTEERNKALGQLAATTGEVERLREALAEVRDFKCYLVFAADKMADIARCALAPPAVVPPRQCQHGKTLRDQSGQVHEPSCGCRYVQCEHEEAIVGPGIVRSEPDPGRCTCGALLTVPPPQPMKEPTKP